MENGWGARGGKKRRWDNRRGKSKRKCDVEVVRAGGGEDSKERKSRREYVKREKGKEMCVEEKLI